MTFKEAESAQLALQAPDEKLVLDDRLVQDIYFCRVFLEHLFSI